MEKAVKHLLVCPNKSFSGDERLDVFRYSPEQLARISHRIWIHHIYLNPRDLIWTGWCINRSSWRLLCTQQFPAAMYWCTDTRIYWYTAHHLKNHLPTILVLPVLQQSNLRHLPHLPECVGHTGGLTEPPLSIRFCAVSMESIAFRLSGVGVLQSLDAGDAWQQQAGAPCSRL